VDQEGHRGGLKADAFRVDDDGISSNWVEFDNGSIAQILMCLATLRHVRRTHCCGLLNVGQVEDIGEAFAKAVSAIHEPVEEPIPNPGHALVKGVAPTDNALLEALTLIVTFREFGADALAASRAAFGR